MCLCLVSTARRLEATYMQAAHTRPAGAAGRERRRAAEEGLARLKGTLDTNAVLALSLTMSARPAQRDGEGDDDVHQAE